MVARSLAATLQAGRGVIKACDSSYRIPGTRYDGVYTTPDAMGHAIASKAFAPLLSSMLLVSVCYTRTPVETCLSAYVTVSTR